MLRTTPRSAGFGRVWSKAVITSWLCEFKTRDRPLARRWPASSSPRERGCTTEAIRTPKLGLPSRQPLLRLAVRRADTPPPRPSTSSSYTSLQHAAPRRRPQHEGAEPLRAQAPALRRDLPGRPVDVQITKAR